jgi:hypothetical protein
VKEERSEIMKFCRESEKEIKEYHKEEVEKIYKESRALTNQIGITETRNGYSRTYYESN